GSRRRSSRQLDVGIAVASCGSSGRSPFCPTIAGPVQRHYRTDASERRGFVLIGSTFCPPCTLRRQRQVPSRCESAQSRRSSRNTLATSGTTSADHDSAGQDESYKRA